MLLLKAPHLVIDRSGKFSEQCILAARKANTALGMIKRNISFKTKDVIVRLYKALVRPRREFCVQAWCPYLRKDIAMIERVKRRGTKLIEGLRYMSYSKHLSHTGLISMEKCRVRGDLIQVFKMLRSKGRKDFNNFLKFSHQITAE